MGVWFLLYSILLPHYRIIKKWRILHASIHITVLFPETREHLCIFPQSFSLLITHLTPRGGVPFETRLKVAGHSGWWPGGHGPAVKRSQGSLIPHVEALDFSWFNATFTILGALRKDEDCHSSFIHPVVVSRLRRLDSLCALKGFHYLSQRFPWYKLSGWWMSSMNKQLL